MQHYADIPFTLVGDSGGGFLDGSPQYLIDIGATSVLPTWLPEYNTLLSTKTVDSKQIFIAPPKSAPQSTFALLDTLDDGVQARRLIRFGYLGGLARLLQKNMSEISAQVPDNFYSYNAPGDYHCITMAPEYYTTVVDGTNLNDWFARLEAGQPVHSIAP
jgi:hypothetical protein